MLFLDLWARTSSKRSMEASRIVPDVLDAFAASVEVR
jgi:hypothetical protein